MEGMPNLDTNPGLPDDPEMMEQDPDVETAEKELDEDLPMAA